ncbi:MAG: hypothetical protein LiPW39_53 [Parcubacteria group bacterium LiPW_39]|nr:MAG: hypothetical protein LiPW39_53 [Parcubacteria group bacterium LiPW_39]
MELRYCITCGKVFPIGIKAPFGEFIEWAGSKEDGGYLAENHGGHIVEILKAIPGSFRSDGLLEEVCKTSLFKAVGPFGKIFKIKKTRRSPEESPEYEILKSPSIRLWNYLFGINR